MIANVGRRELDAWDPLHNSSRPVIARPRAVCGVEFLANSRAIGCKIRLAAHPDPAYTNSR